VLVVPESLVHHHGLAFGIVLVKMVEVVGFIKLWIFCLDVLGIVSEG
jgi:hypothetical protein